MANRNRYVVKRDAGGWDVLKEGHRRASAHERSKAGAIARAKALTRRAGGGKVIIMGRSGKIAEENTVPRTSRNRRVK